MGSVLDELVSILDLEDIEENLFRGRSPDEDRQRVFGGQVAGQALVAAYRTLSQDATESGSRVHSLHAYFLRPGDTQVPIIYEVERIRDGRSFSTRRVIAIQHGQAIFHLSASFHGPEAGLEHQDAMPDAPDPESVPTLRERIEPLFDEMPQEVRRWAERKRPIELRYVGPIGMLSADKSEPVRQVWMRADGRLPDDPKLHQCVAAYASDFTLLDTALLPHGIPWAARGFMMASLDHAMWFHRPFRADEWLLYDQRSPHSSGARGFTRAELWTRAGELVASVAQEGLIRPLRPRSGRKAKGS